MCCQFVSSAIATTKKIAPSVSLTIVLVVPDVTMSTFSRARHDATIVDDEARSRRAGRGTCSAAARGGCGRGGLLRLRGRGGRRRLRPAGAPAATGGGCRLGGDPSRLGGAFRLALGGKARALLLDRDPGRPDVAAGDARRMLLLLVLAHRAKRNGRSGSSPRIPPGPAPSLERGVFPRSPIRGVLRHGENRLDPGMFWVGKPSCGGCR